MGILCFGRRLLPAAGAFLFWLGALPFPGRANDQQEALELLQQVGETYANLTSYHFRAHDRSETEAGGRTRKIQRVFETIVDASGRSRVELEDSAQSGVAVYDGETSWLYLERLNQYRKRRAAPVRGLSSQPPLPGEIDLQKYAGQYPIRYRSAAERVESARIVGKETLGVNEKGVECVVVQAVYEPPQAVAAGEIRRTYWIDPESKLVIREVSRASHQPSNLPSEVTVTQTIDFETAKAGGEFPDYLFEFLPPAGAQEVEQFGAAHHSRPGVEGRPAPDFSAGNLDGEPVRLSDFEGKVVVLDFWATWCVPCRIDLPRMDAIYREWRDAGLVVLGVNNEPVETASAYIKQHGYSFPVVRDPQNEIARRYQVSAIPTAVVIDREGRISEYLVGTHPERQIREAVKKASLKPDPRFE